MRPPNWTDGILIIDDDDTSHCECGNCGMRVDSLSLGCPECGYNLQWDTDIVTYYDEKWENVSDGEDWAPYYEKWG